MSWIGGVLAYVVLKDRNSKTATNMLVFGIVWAFVFWFILAIAIAAFVFGLFTGFAQP